LQILRVLIVRYRDNFFFYQSCLVKAVEMTEGELTDVSNRLLVRVKDRRLYLFYFLFILFFRLRIRISMIIHITVTVSYIGHILQRTL